MDDVERKRANDQLVHAAQGGDSYSVCEALKAGASPEAADDRGRFALLLAARAGCDSCVRELINAGARVNRLAPYSNSDDTLTEGTALNQACRFNRWEVIKTLLAHRADPRILAHRLNNSPAHILLSTISAPGKRDAASLIRLKGMLEQLIDAGNPLNQLNSNGESLVTLTINHKAPVSITQMLLERGATPELLSPGSSHRSWDMDRMEHLRALVSAGADINTRDFLGASALSQALDTDVQAIMVEMGADVNHLDNMGQTLLIRLLRDGQTTLSSIKDRILHLVACGADPDLADYTGESASQILAEKKDSSSEQTLAAIAAFRARQAMNSTISRVRSRQPQ